MQLLSRTAEKKWVKKYPSLIDMLAYERHEKEPRTVLFEIREQAADIFALLTCGDYNNNELGRRWLVWEVSPTDVRIGNIYQHSEGYDEEHCKLHDIWFVNPQERTGDLFEYKHLPNHAAYLILRRVHDWHRLENGSFGQLLTREVSILICRRPKKGWSALLRRFGTKANTHLDISELDPRVFDRHPYFARQFNEIDLLKQGFKAALEQGLLAWAQQIKDNGEISIDDLKIKAVKKGLTVFELSCSNSSANAVFLADIGLSTVNGLKLKGVKGTLANLEKLIEQIQDRFKTPE